MKMILITIHSEDRSAKKPNHYFEYSVANRSFMSECQRIQNISMGFKSSKENCEK